MQTSHPKNTVILTHGDVDGVCAAAIAKASYPKAEVEFTNPSDLVSKLDSLSGHDRVIVLDLGIDSAQKDEAIAAFQKLSKTSSIIYIDHHLRSPGVTERSLSCTGMHRTSASTSELAWEFFKPATSHDFIAVLGAIGDYREKTPQMQGLIERYDERRVYPEALFLEWALMVAEDSFKRGVVEELAQGKWPYQMAIMGEEADSIVRRQRTLERYVQENAEKICEHVMLVRDPPFKATGPAAALLTKLDNVDVGIASRRERGGVYLSLRRHNESDINLAALIEESTFKFGGAGGGHKEAAGGKVPAERFDELLLEIKRRAPEGRLKRIKELEVGFADKKTIERRLFKEIIERKRAEEMLRIRNLAVESSINAIAFADLEGNLTYVNPSFLKLWGYDDEKEVLGRSVEEFWQKAEKALEVIEALRDRGSWIGEMVAMRKDGSMFDVQISTSIITDDSGKPICIMGSFVDITERKRAEFNKNFKLLFNAMVDPVAIVDMKGRILEVTNRAEEITGIKKEELLGKNFMRAKIPFTVKSKALLIKLFLTAIGKKIPPFEVEVLTKDGKKIPFEVKSAKIEYMGKPAIMVVFRGITERKRAEEELRKHREHLEELVEKRTIDLKKINEELQREITERKRAEELLKKYSERLEQHTQEIQESEEKYRIQFEEALDAILVADAETGIIIDCNRAALQLVGREKSEIIGQHQKILHPPEEIEGEFSRTFKLHIKEKAGQVLEAQVITKKGEIRDVAIKANLFELRGRKIIQGIFRDITEHKQAEEALRESEERYRDLFENANDLIQSVKPNGKFAYVNRRWLEVLGYTKDEVEKLTLWDILRKDQIPHCMEVFKRVCSGEEVTGIEAVFVSKNGKEIHVEGNSNAYFKDGKLVATRGIFRDITERKRAEDKIKMEREVYRSIACAANLSRSVEELCELALKGIQTAIKYDMADVMVYREPENALLSAAQVGYPEDLYQRTIKRQDLKKESRVAVRAVREGKSIYIDDMKTNNLVSYAHDLVAKYDISTLYVVPLFNWGKLQGVLEVLTIGNRKLSKEDREVLDTVSEELAGGIAKAKSEEQLVTVKEAFGWLAKG